VARPCLVRQTSTTVNPGDHHPSSINATRKTFMTSVQFPKKMTFNRDDVEQIAYVIFRLEQLIDSNDELAPPVTQYLIGDTSTEWLAGWLNTINSVLRRRLFPLSPASATFIPKFPKIRP
jgi:hypothetical protein